jgi:hypothetical protein
VRSWIQKEDGDNEFHCRRAKKGRAEGRHDSLISYFFFPPHLVTVSGFFQSSVDKRQELGRKRGQRTLFIGHCRKLAESKRTWNAKKMERDPSGVATRSAGAVTGMDREKLL